MTPEAEKRLKAKEREIDECRDVLNYLKGQTEQKEKQLAGLEKEMSELLKNQFEKL